MHRIELFYWPSIPGRGEFVRLILEDVEVEYTDVARAEGTQALIELLRDSKTTALAPPILRIDGRLIGQSALIASYLADRFELVPVDEHARTTAFGYALTIADFVDEIHDLHHPLGPERYYEEQRGTAEQRAAGFREHRLPKYLRFFERIVRQNDNACLLPTGHSYPDLALFQTLVGLKYALPHTLGAVSDHFPSLNQLVERVGNRPSIEKYLRSERRIPFNEDGIFRHYPELDPAPPPE